MALSAVEVEKIVSDSLESARQDRVALKTQIETLDTKVKTIVAGMPSITKESDAELQAALQKLEYSHSTTAQNNSQERQFMRDLDKIKQKRKNLAIHEKMQAEVDQLRAKRNELMQQVREKENTIDELSLGLRKLRTANKTGADSNDIVEEKYVIDESKAPRVIGKGGSNLRALEAEHGVAIDVDRTGGGIRLTGTPMAIQNALTAITSIVETAIEEFTLSEDIIICMLLEQSKLLHEIQDTYHVRLDLSRAKGVCKITGLYTHVDMAKARILAIPGYHVDLMVENDYLPFLIGKGGSTIATLEEQFNVHVHLNRERLLLEVRGLKSNVLAAVASIKDLIDTNKEIEESIQVEKHILLGVFLENKGENMKLISKEFGVRLDIEGNKEDAVQSVKIKGNRGKIFATRQHIDDLITRYLSTCLILQVDEEFMPFLLGKGGSRIKAMREKFPTASVDIDKQRILIQCGDAEVREAIHADVQAVIDENYSETLRMPEQYIIQLKSSNGATLRSELMDELQLKLFMDKENTEVKLRGPRDKVEAGIRKLQDFQATFCMQSIAIDEEDFGILMKGGEEGSLLQEFRTKFAVEMVPFRKESILHIKGHPDNVIAAKTALLGYLSGDIAYESQLLVINPLVLSAIIGKSGANLKKIEEEQGVKVDILKTRNQLRLYGASAEKLEAATEFLFEFMDQTKVHDVIEIGSYRKQFEAAKKAVCEVFQVEFTECEDKNKMIIRGVFRLMEAAKKYLIAHRVSFTDTTEYPIYVGPASIAAMEASHILNAHQLRRILEKTKTTIELRKKDHSVAIRGTLAAIHAAKPEVFGYLTKQLSSTRFHAEDIPLGCLRDMFTWKSIRRIEESGCHVDIDYAAHYLLLANDVEDMDDSIAGGLAVVREQLQLWHETNDSISIEEFMIPLLVGKGGATINALRKETSLVIEIDRTSLCVDIKAASKDILEAGRAVLQAKIDKMHSEHWETTVPADMYGQLIGKQGANINKMRTDTGASIDVDPKTNLIKVNGSEEVVQKAKEAILDFIRSEEKNKVITRYLSIPAAAVPVIIGTKGATISQLQEASGAKLDLERGSQKCIFKGSAEACEKAMALVTELLDKEGFLAKTPEPTAAAATPEPEPEPIMADPQPTGIKRIPGAPPAVMARMAEKANTAGLSKSSLKRLRKKEREQQQLLGGVVESKHGAEEEDDEEEEDASPAPPSGWSAIASKPAAEVKAVIPPPAAKPLPTSAPPAAMKVESVKPAAAPVAPVNKAAEPPKPVEAANKPPQLTVPKPPPAPIVAPPSIANTDTSVQLFNMLLGDNNAVKKLSTPLGNKAAAASAPVPVASHHSVHVRGIIGNLPPAAAPVNTAFSSNFTGLAGTGLLDKVPTPPPPGLSPGYPVNSKQHHNSFNFSSFEGGLHAAGMSSTTAPPAPFGVSGHPGMGLASSSTGSVGAPASRPAAAAVGAGAGGGGHIAGLEYLNIGSGNSSSTSRYYGSGAGAVGGTLGSASHDSINQEYYRAPPAVAPAAAPATTSSYYKSKSGFSVRL